MAPAGIMPLWKDWTIHLTPLYLETGYFHGRVGVKVIVWVRVMVGVRMK